MKGKRLSPQTQCRDMIPSVNDTEIRKQLSKMGRNKTCELDNLLIEEIIMVAELNLLLKDYTAEDNGKWYPDSWKKDSYGNNIFTLNVKCLMPIKKHYWWSLLYFH